MTGAVLLTDDAERDLEDIWHHVAAADGIARADRLLAALQKLCADFAELPSRGNVPKELSTIGMTEYREVHFKPYRVIYRATDEAVFIILVADGRRDMQTLLERRLFRP